MRMNKYQKALAIGTAVVLASYLSLKANANFNGTSQKVKQTSSIVRCEESDDDSDFCAGCCCGAMLGGAFCSGNFFTSIDALAGDLITGENKIHIDSNSPVKSFLLGEITDYQHNVSPKITKRYGHVCRFEPSCSEYGRQAIQRYGAGKGTLLTLGRLIRCNPLQKRGTKDPLN